MHKKNNLIKCFLICLAIVSLTSCTSTRLISAWEPDTMDQFAPGKILVTGMSDDMEKTCYVLKMPWQKRSNKKAWMRYQASR